MEPKTPEEWLRHGQALEARNTAADLATAARCYERAIELLRSSPAEQTHRELGIVWMNLGNVRQKQEAPNSSTDAVQAYDNAIEFFAAISTPEDLVLLNSIGAAWMNRGHALQRRNTSEAITAAIDSYDRAIAQLEVLPLDANRAFVINLSAAWMNRARANLSFTTPDTGAAYEAAVKAIQLTAPTIQTDPAVADIALRSHHVLCFALSQRLAGKSSPELIAETGDNIDESLALIHHWENNGVPNFRPLAVVFYHFGAKFYLSHQPQFLAEFLLETLDHAKSSGTSSHLNDFIQIAASSLGQAKSDAYNRSLFEPSNIRLHDLRQGLEDAEKRLGEFQEIPPASVSMA